MSELFSTGIVSPSINSELAAWILPISQTMAVAVGRYELKFIEYIRTCISLPGLPAFCERGFIWRNHFIPVLDVHALVTRRRIPATEGEQMAAIIAYENTQGGIELGAILLRGVPKLIPVASTQAIPVSALTQEWHLLAQAAFKDDTGGYPVLDLRSLFDKTPADLLSLH